RSPRRIWSARSRSIDCAVDIVVDNCVTHFVHGEQRPTLARRPRRTGSDRRRRGDAPLAARAHARRCRHRRPRVRSARRRSSLGISYDGTCAEMLLVNRHPAVRAVAPMFSLYDAYTDIGFPGGVHLAWFTEHWGRFNALLDRNAPHEAFALMIWMLARARLGI